MLEYHKFNTEIFAKQDARPRRKMENRKLRSKLNENNWGRQCRSLFTSLDSRNLYSALSTMILLHLHTDRLGPKTLARSDLSSANIHDYMATCTTQGTIFRLPVSVRIFIYFQAIKKNGWTSLPPYSCCAS